MKKIIGLIIVICCSYANAINVGQTAKLIFGKYKENPKIEKEDGYVIATYETEKSRKTKYYFQKGICQAVRYVNLAGMWSRHVEETKKFYTEKEKNWYQNTSNKISSTLMLGKETHYRGKKSNDIDLILHKEDTFTILVANVKYWKYTKEKEAKKKAEREEKSSLKRTLK